MRRFVGAATIAALALALAACAPVAVSGWVPPDWPSAPYPVTTAPAPLDAAAVGGLRAERIRNDGVGIQARWALASSQDAFNARMTAVVTDAIGARESDTGVAYSPQVFDQGAGMADRTCVAGSTLRPAAEILADPALAPAGGSGTAIVCDVVAASGSYLGERVRVVSGDAGTVTHDDATIVYAHLATDEVATAEQLWIEDAEVTLWEGIVAGLRRDAGSLSLATVAPPDEAQAAGIRTALASTVFAPDGAAVITIPAGFTAPELAALGFPPTSEPMVLAVPTDTAASLLTPFGLAVSAAVGSAATFEAPATVTTGFWPVDCTLVPCVAMTYDAGPSSLTPGILDDLAAHNAAATFFALGSRAAANVGTLQRIVAEGSLVENHSWSHPDLTTLTDAQIAAQLGNTTTVLTRDSGQQVTVFRPPYGAYDDTVLEVAGMAAILWDVDTEDWRQPGDDVVIARAVGQPRPGSIVLQHDIQQTTARTASAVYDGLADRGFTLVNLRQLFGGQLPGGGVWRSTR
ncbi:hypothetical protein GCM10009808_01030 [Microbacterium sediminicola]|uniref:NodB homology domain-containing protein n=1 Tax=Microbacterium sediminicola TaxID=415210 RepID=A0ABN2HH32_9MICO